MPVDLRSELSKLAGTAPLTAEPIYHALAVFVGGPCHGEPIPVSLLNHNIIDMPVGRGSYAEDIDSPEAAAGFEITRYIRGKFAAGGSRRVLDVWYFADLSEDERGALTWLLILERAGLT